MQNIFEASACVAIFGFCGFALAAFLVTFVITGARNSGVAAHKITINVREKRVVVHSLFALLGLLTASPLAYLAYCLCLEQGGPTWLVVGVVELESMLLTSIFLPKFFQEEYDYIPRPEATNLNQGRAERALDQAWNALIRLESDLGLVLEKNSVSRHREIVCDARRTMDEGRYTAALSAALSVLRFCQIERENARRNVRALARFATEALG